MDYTIEGNEYTSPDFDADLFAREMIAKCEASNFPWSEIRVDDDGCVYAYNMGANLETHSGNWSRKNSMGFAKFLGQLDGDEFEWSEFGIIRKTEADSMNYKIVGTDGYKPHPSHMENIAMGLVSDATTRCDDWQEIRIDADGIVFAYDTIPNKSKNDSDRFWVFDGDEGDSFRLTDLSTEIEVGLNWQTFGIIRTEEAEADAKKFTAKLSEYELFEWRARNVRYQAGPTVSLGTVENTETALTPERTIAERQLWADEFASMIFSEVREMTKLQETVTLTPELISALSDWPDSALETIAQAIADGRIVLQ